MASWQSQLSEHWGPLWKALLDLLIKRLEKQDGSLDGLNRRRHCPIVTGNVDDKRELGIGTGSFSIALRSVRRCVPDSSAGPHR
jgi:hypothetical protein